jgi:adenosylcobinamide amidohydrolase
MTPAVILEYQDLNPDPDPFSDIQICNSGTFNIYLIFDVSLFQLLVYNKLLKFTDAKAEAIMPREDFYL